MVEVVGAIRWNFSGVSRGKGCQEVEWQPQDGSRHGGAVSVCDISGGRDNREDSVVGLKLADRYGCRCCNEQ